MKHDSPRTAWKNISKILFENRKNIFPLFIDDEMRTRIQFFGLYIIFAAVSTVMTVLNFVTHYDMLGWSTLIFGLANVLNLLFALNSKGSEYFSRVLFVFEIFSLFVFFIIKGDPQGFSAIWIVLLPACGMLLFKIRKGLIISFAQFLILIFFFWTKTGRGFLMFEYTDSFLLRFPVLYLSFLAVGILFEALRQLTQNELIKTKNDFEYMSNHDTLTGLFNRMGFNKEINNLIENVGKDGAAFAIIDLDHFKKVNDIFGHLCGDEVLKGTAATIERVVGNRGSVSRWGGEEFAVIIDSYEESERICKEILDAIRLQVFCFGESKYKITASLGLVKIYGEDKNGLSQLVKLADNNLYTAKENGRDRMVVSVI